MNILAVGTAALRSLVLVPWGQASGALRLDGKRLEAKVTGRKCALLIA